MVYNSEDMKTTQVPTEKGMDKETVTHILYGVQLSHYKGLKSTFCTIFFFSLQVVCPYAGLKKEGISNSGDFSFLIIGKLRKKTYTCHFAPSIAIKFFPLHFTMIRYFVYSIPGSFSTVLNSVGSCS